MKPIQGFLICSALLLGACQELSSWLDHDENKSVRKKSGEAALQQVA